MCTNILKAILMISCRRSKCVIYKTDNGNEKETYIPKRFDYGNNILVPTDVA